MSESIINERAERAVADIEAAGGERFKGDARMAEFNWGVFQ